MSIVTARDGVVGLPVEVFDSFRRQIAAGSFHGFNWPGAQVSQGLIRNCWR